jgi:hypothetical protein
MRSFTRRKAPVKRAEVWRLHDLPEDILILIFSQCRIDELLALRLTSQHINNLISEYIVTIAPSVARSTFPQSDLLLTPLPDRSQYTLKWLLGLIPRQLAAILVDRHRLSSRNIEGRSMWAGLAAEDPLGDGLRARVTNGWYVLQHLSTISRNIHRTRSGDTSKATRGIISHLINSTQRHVDTMRDLEDLVMRTRIEYMRDLEAQDIRDYNVLMILLSAIFNPDRYAGSNDEEWIFDWSNGIEANRTFRTGESWMTWFVLAEGADIFWKQWWSLPPHSANNYIYNCAAERFRRTPAALGNRQRSHAHAFMRFVKNVADAETVEGFILVNPYRFFPKPELYTYAGPEIMEHVPFYVHFRRPD